jgi:hypothetical protein
MPLRRLARPARLPRRGPRDVAGLAALMKRGLVTGKSGVPCRIVSAWLVRHMAVKSGMLVV